MHKPVSKMEALTLKQYQQLFTKNLLSVNLSNDDAKDLLSHLVPMFKNDDNSEEATDRLNIYRNNVILSLSTAIADTFPVVKRLIGDDCFNSAAVDFVRNNPPSQPSLLFYGEGFIGFINDFPACSELTFLGDVAQLEWNYIQAFHAEDSDLLDNESLAQISAESLSEVKFSLHPSVQLMQSDWPIDTIWEENLKDEVATINIDEHSGCNLVLYRQDLQVQVINLTIECFNFLHAFSINKNIADAWSYTNEQQQLHNRTPINEDELPAMLGYLLSLSLFESAHLE